MFKYAFLIAFALPACCAAADYIGGHKSQVSCTIDQSGSRYCVEAPPVEKLISDCDPGVNCTHMQSGQHYSVQPPVVSGN